MRNGTAGVPWLPRPQGFRAACHSCQGFSNSRVCAFFSIRVRNVSQNIGSLDSVQSDLGQSSSCYVGASMAILRWPARTKVFQECGVVRFSEMCILLTLLAVLNPRVPNRRASPACSSAEYPSSAQPQSIPLVCRCRVYKRRVSLSRAQKTLQCQPQNTNTQPQNIPAAPNLRVSVLCPTQHTTYSRCSLQCPNPSMKYSTLRYPWNVRPQSIA